MRGSLVVCGVAAFGSCLVWSGRAQPINDLFVNRIPLTGYSVRVSGSTADAFWETSEPYHAGNTGGKSAWWSWTAPASGAVTILTEGSDFDTLLGVYTGTAVNALSTVAGNDDDPVTGSRSSRVTFDAISGVSYQIAVDGYYSGAPTYSTASGSVRLTILLTVTGGDLFSSRPALTGVVAQGGGSSGSATKESGEPNHAGNTGGHSLWWQWTAPAGGDVALTTAGSSFDTLLAVYTGTIVNALTEVASNDDERYPAISTSLLNFNAVAGVTYSIAVDGYGGASGTVQLGLSFRREPALDSREDFWVPDLQVNAVLVTNGMVCIGGDFNYVGPNRGGAIVLDALTGAEQEDFPRISGSVYAVAADGRGGRYIGGWFNQVGGVPCTNLAHLLPDDSVDLNWRPPTSGAVFALAVGDGVIYAGGPFTNIAGLVRNRLASLDLANGVPTAWNPNVNDEVTCLLLARDTRQLFLGGAFTSVGGQPRNRLAAVSIDTGLPAAWDPGADEYVTALGRLDAALFVAGYFTNIGGITQPLVAKLDVYSGLAYNDWRPTFDFGVWTLAVNCNQVLVGGQFFYVNGTPRYGLAALDPTTGGLRPFNAQIESGISPYSGVTSLAVRGNALYFGGRFRTVAGQSRVGMAAVDANAGTLFSWSPIAGGNVQTLQVSGQSVFVGGGPVSVGGVPRTHMAVYDAQTGKLLDWDPQLDGTVYALACVSNTVYVGGAFLSAGGQTRHSLAAFDAWTGALKDWDPLGTAPVFIRAMKAVNGALYVGGNFAGYMGLAPRTNVAALDLTYGDATAWNPAANNAVFALAVNGTNLVAGGAFTRIGGQNRTRLAELDGSTGLARTWNPGANGNVLSLAVQGNRIFIGGLFSQVGSVSRSHLAAVDSAGTVSTWNPSPDAAVRALAPGGSEIYVGGDFATLSGQSRSMVAAFDSSTLTLKPWNPVVEGINLAGVWDMAVSQDAVLVGGKIGRVNGQHRRNLLVFPSKGSPIIVDQSGDQVVPSGSTVILSVNAQGDAPLRYQWSVDGYELPGATNASCTISPATPTRSGEYEVAVFNAWGRVTSRPITVTAYVAPVITQQTGDQTVSSNSTVVLSVTVSGSPAPWYQWRRNGVNLPWQNQSNLVLSAIQPWNGGSYSVVAANAGGLVRSTPVNVLVTTTSLAFQNAFASREAITGGSGLGRGSNVGASKETGEPNHAGDPGGHSVWLKWTAPSNGIAYFGTEGSSFDTLLGVYTNNTLAGLAEVASDDDDGSGRSLDSLAVFAARAGTTYQIAVDGFAGATGNIVLYWGMIANQADIPFIRHAPGNQTVPTGGTATFTVDVLSTSPLHYQWLFGCNPIPRATNSTLTVTNVQEIDVGNYSVVAVNDSNYPIESWPAFLDIGGQAGVGTADKFLDVVPQVQIGALEKGGRSRRNAPATGYIGSQIFSTFGSTTEPGEPTHCGLAGGASEWFAYQPPADGMLTVDTDGSDFDTVLAVYTGPGTDFETLINVGCDNDSGADHKDSKVMILNARSNTVYYIAVDGVNGANGTVRLHYSLATVPQFTVQPLSQTAAAGATVTLNVTANGSPTVAYQWRCNGTNLVGATNASLTITNFQAANSGAYTVVATTSAGSTTSSAAGLYLNSPLRFSGGYGMTSNRTMGLRLLGTAGQQYVIEAGVNMTNDWVPIFTSTPPYGVIEFTDPASSNLNRRFYRGKK